MLCIIEQSPLSPDDTADTETSAAHMQRSMPAGMNAMNQDRYCPTVQAGSSQLERAFSTLVAEMKPCSDGEPKVQSD